MTNTVDWKRYLLKYRGCLIVLFILIWSYPIDAKPETPKFLKIDIHKATHSKSPTGFYISWQSNRPDNYYFILEKQINGGAWQQIQRSVRDRRKKFYFDPAIVPNMNYCYRVKLKGRYRKDGSPTWIESESDFTAAVCQKAPTIPLKPTNVTGTIQYPELGKVKFIFNWQDKANNENGYKVELYNQYGHKINTKYLPANATSIILNDTGNMVNPLSIKLRAYNMYYSPYSEKITLTPKGDLIPAPKNLRVGNVSSNSIRLLWFNPTNYRDIRLQRRCLGKAYEIKKKTLHINPQFKIYKWVKGNPVPAYFIDNNVEAASRYEYRISGRLNIGESKFSNIVSVTSKRDLVTIPQNQQNFVPNRPINLRASLSGSTTVKLNWVDRSNNENGFGIEARFDNVLQFKQIATVGKNIVGFTINHLKPSTEYYFRVRAFNEKGKSMPSNTVRIRTQKPR